MPIYEYRCSSCGHELESLRKFSDAPLLECPACHAEALVKKVSVAGFQLKGSGWYATDFRNGSKPASAKADDNAGGSDAAVSAKGDAATGSKGDAATGSKGDAATGSKGDAAAGSKGDAAPASANPAATKAESAPVKVTATPSAGSSKS